MPRSFRYDVAFSLLARDAPLAEGLADQLAPLKCFVFTAQQRELVGRNGVEAFAEIFRRESRLSVVLFRKDYGLTDFTDLEVRGIQDRGLETRWQSPMLVNLDGSAPPGWYPHRNIWLDLQRYPLDQAVGAIRLRAEELGASPGVESAADRLDRLVQKKSDYDRRQAHERSELGRNELDAEITELLKLLQEAFENATPKLQPLAPRFIPVQRGVALATRFGSAVVESRLNSNRSPSGRALYIKYYDGYVSAGGLTAARDPELLSDVEYLPTFAIGDAWQWQPDDKSRPMSTHDLKEYVLKQLYEAAFSRLNSLKY